MQELKKIKLNDLNVVSINHVQQIMQIVAKQSQLETWGPPYKGLPLTAAYQTTPLSTHLAEHPKNTSRPVMSPLYTSLF